MFNSLPVGMVVLCAIIVAVVVLVFVAALWKWVWPLCTRQSIPHTTMTPESGNPPLTPAPSRASSLNNSQAALTPTLLKKPLLCAKGGVKEDRNNGNYTGGMYIELAFNASLPELNKYVYNHLSDSLRRHLNDPALSLLKPGHLDIYASNEFNCYLDFNYTNTSVDMALSLYCAPCEADGSWQIFLKIPKQPRGNTEVRMLQVPGGRLSSNWTIRELKSVLFQNVFQGGCHYLEDTLREKGSQIYSKKICTNKQSDFDKHGSEKTVNIVALQAQQVETVILMVKNCVPTDKDRDWYGSQSAPQDCTL